MSNERQSDFVPIREAAKLTGLAASTIRKMADQSTISCYRTPSGQRRINIQSIQALVSNFVPLKDVKAVQKQDFVYARVSTKKQMSSISSNKFFN